MPIPPVGSLATIGYQCNSPAGAYVLHRGEHREYALANIRCNTNLVPITPNYHQITSNPNPTGNAVNLPFHGNLITSVRLPHPAAALGINFFCTHNMSGCKFFVDSIAGSNDVMVYHASHIGVGTGGNDLPHYQQAVVTTALNTLHTNTRNVGNEYAGLGLANLTSLGKPQYNICFSIHQMTKRARVTQRKAQDRLNLATKVREREFYVNGGTTIVGYPAAAGWEFHWQTFGSVGYRRPSKLINKIHALFTGHWNYLYKVSRQTNVETTPFGVLGHGLI